METIKISIKNDFSLTPGPRYIKEGEFSGEKFRKDILQPKFEFAIKENGKVCVDLDGTFGFGTSFLEEVFGGLAREYRDINVMEHLDLISEEEPYLIDDIKKYITEASKGK